MGAKTPSAAARPADERTMSGPDACNRDRPNSRTAVTARPSSKESSILTGFKGPYPLRARQAKERPSHSWSAVNDCHGPGAALIDPRILRCVPATIGASRLIAWSKYRRTGSSSAARAPLSKRVIVPEATPGTRVSPPGELLTADQTHPDARRTGLDHACAVTTAAPAIACVGLGKRFGTFDAVVDLDLDVPQGSITGFLGPNGAGKTTVLRLLAGLTRPTSGRALLWGHPARQPAARRRLGYMPSDPGFAGGLTGRANLDLLSRLQGRAPVDRDWACELLDLGADDLARPVREYSSGMAQKLGIVQAVQHRPALVILDEPANRLDPLAHRRFEQVIRTFRDRGDAVFLSSHTLSEVQDVCDRVAMVRAGRLLDVRGVAELREAQGRRVRITYRASPPPAPAGLESPESDGHVLTGRVRAGRMDLLRDLISDPDITDVLVEELSLEETFVDLYAKAARG
jgi:ABC-2 type transport system ATP-binding protein